MPAFRRAAAVTIVEPQHRRHDARGAIRRRSDNFASCSILLVDRERPRADPIHRDERIGNLVPFALLERLANFCRATFDVETTGQDSLLAQPAIDARAHRGPDAIESGTNLLLAAQRTLVAHH